MGNIFACDLLIRLGSVRLSLICIDGTRTCSTALHFLRRCTKMAGLAQKSNNFFGVASTNSQTDGKNVSYRWVILRIKYFLLFSYNKHIFPIKEIRFHIYIPSTGARISSVINYVMVNEDERVGYRF